MAQLKKDESNPRGLGHSNNYFCIELSSFFIASAQLNSRTTNHHDSFASDGDEGNRNRCYEPAFSIETEVGKNLERARSSGCHQSFSIQSCTDPAMGFLLVA